jgi:hypothetical protein
MISIPCLLCGADLRRRTSKRNKPYFVCEPCGVQFFIRRKQGIKNLDELIEMLSRHEYHFREHTQVLCQIQAVLTEMRGVQKEIKSTASELGFFTSAKDKKAKQRILDVLELRMKTLHSQLAELARKGSPRSA